MTDVLLSDLPPPFSLRAFCPCAIGSGTGCMRRPRARARRSAPDGSDCTERGDGSGDDGAGDDPPESHRDAGRRP